jgi:hypothetical protein
MSRIGVEEKALYWAWMQERVKALWLGKGKGPTKKQCWHMAQKEWNEMRQLEKQEARRQAST